MRAFSKKPGFVGLLTIALALGAGSAQAQQQLTDTSGAAAPATQATSVPQPYYGSISVSTGSGRLLKLPHPVANIFAADPSVIEVRPASPDTMFVFGKSVGETTIVATDAAGNPIAQYSVSVNPTQYPANELQNDAQTLAPGSGVTAQSLPGGMVVGGTVQTAEQANNVMEQARLLAPSGTVVNNLQVQEPIQVQLKVRIAQMSRSITRQLGINWSSVGTSAISIGKFSLTGNTASASPSISGTSPGYVGVTFPGGTFQGVIDALASDNLAHVLAEPTLTTLSGTKANFQVGGQFPIPVSSVNGAVSVSFQNYGILLSFTPTVFSDGRIALQVAPQFSEVSSANSASISTAGSSSTIVVPSLTITSASTTVILGSGQGMAIAGLLEDTSNQTDNGVPGLSEVPLLGALFRGDAFQRTEQELVITVTPYIVNPVSNPGVLASPDDGWTPPNDLQRILLLRDNGTQDATNTIPGDAGFMVQ